MQANQTRLYRWWAGAAVLASIISGQSMYPQTVLGAAAQEYAIVVQLAPPTPTVTPTPPTGTETPTPTATATHTPGPVSTPFMFHFEEATVGQAGGWFNEYNCAMTTSGQGSSKALVGGLASWGRATSNTLTLNVDTNNTLRVVVTEVDASTGNRIYLHESGQTAILVADGVGAGITDINIPAKTGWSGVKSFYLEIVIESTTPNTGTRFDEIWVYPSSAQGFTEDFRTSGTPPGGWFHEYNVTFAANGNDSAKLVTNAGDAWGSATSNTQTLNVDTFGVVTVVVTEVDPSTGNKLLVHETGQSDIQIASGIGVGIHNYDLKSLTGWSGTKSFYLKLVVESSTAGKGTRFDQVSIGAVNQ